MRLPLLLALLLAATGASAADYRAEAGSTLGFSASYQDEAFEGGFGKFTPAIRFDPADLAASRFDVRIDLSSAGTENADRDELLLGPDFFDASARPEARYVATRFRALGGNRYAADGQLSLRGVHHFSHRDAIQVLAAMRAQTVARTAGLGGAPRELGMERIPRD